MCQPRKPDQMRRQIISTMQAHKIRAHDKGGKKDGCLEMWGAANHTGAE